jgi:outer membrane lipoprotein-sorting protein
MKQSFLKLNRLEFIFLCLCILGAVILNTALASETQQSIPPDRLAAVLEEAREEFGKVNTLKTKLTQEKNISLFAAPVISEGIFLFKSPDKIRFEFHTPFQSALIVNQNRIFKYEKVKGQWEALNQGDQKIAGIILDHMAAWVKGRFNHGDLYTISGEYTPGTTPEHPEKVSFILTPRAEEFRQFIQSFELGINNDLNRLDYIVIRETKTDFTRIAFHDDQINPPLDDLLFTGSDIGPAPVPPW